MKRIDISTPKHPNTFTFVDDEEYDELSKHKWTAHEKGSVIYAERRIVVKGKSVLLLMHQTIMGSLAQKLHDHRNGNGLDNQKSNLRPCTHKQNIQNQKRNSTNKSGFKGVSWKKNQSLWIAQITIDGNNLNLGCHICIVKAAYLYNCAAVKYFGEFARLNEIRPNCAVALAEGAKT